jgi:hypothetical protein
MLLWLVLPLTALFVVLFFNGVYGWTRLHIQSADWFKLMFFSVGFMCVGYGCAAVNSGATDLVASRHSKAIEMASMKMKGRFRSRGERRRHPQ